MANIFISYKREDKKAAAMLADRLEGSGWTVWWDHDLLGGEDYDERIVTELKEASCVVVIWSELSIHSRNVKDEARKAVNRNILIPVSFDNSEPPIGFGMTHVISFQSKNRITEEEFEKLRESILRKVRPDDVPIPPPPPLPPSFLKKYGYYIAALLTLAVAYLIYIFSQDGGQKKPDQVSLVNATDTGTSFVNEPIIGTPKTSEEKIDKKKNDLTQHQPSSVANETEVANLLPEAEQLTNSLLNAMKAKDVEGIVAISSTPFYSDNKILTSIEDIRSSFQSMMDSKGDRSFPEIKSIKVKKVSEWKQEGLINENDRILKNMNISDNDYYAGVTFDHDGLGIAFRLVNGKLKVAGMWD